MITYKVIQSSKAQAPSPVVPSKPLNQWTVVGDTVATLHTRSFFVRVATTPKGQKFTFLHIPSGKTKVIRTNGPVDSGAYHESVVAIVNSQFIKR